MAHQINSHDCVGSVRFVDHGDSSRHFDGKSSSLQVPDALAIGLPHGADIEALAFTVLMEATESANQDLATIMSEVKAITAAKQKLREIIYKVNQDVASNACQTNKQPPLDLSNGMGSVECRNSPS